MRRGGNGARTALLAAALALATLVVFAPVRQFGFVNFDDPGYVSANPEIARGLDARAVAWAFTTNRTANWSPLTWLSYQLDVTLFGVDPAAHHVVNVLLHVGNVLLLLLLLRQLGCPPAAALVIAALFALHPMRVESVAWISERKDVLCALFGLASLNVWVRWTRVGGWGRYAAALALYAASLMAKPMLVTFPFVLLLLDLYPLRRLRGAWTASDGTDGTAPRGGARLLVEKLPLFALALASSVVTVIVQRSGGAVADPAVLPLAARVRGAVAAYGWYVVKSLWPVDLAVLYPNPALVGGRPATADVVVGALVLVVGGAFALRERRRRPWLLVGLGIFAGMLVPVIGLIQVGQQSTADRYSYLPSIGLFVALVGLAAEGARRLRLAPAVCTAVVVGILLALGIATRHQLGFWRDSVTLARRALDVTRDNFVMHFNLAHALDDRGDLPGALRNYGAAARLRPDLAMFRVNHAAALVRAGRVDEGVAEYGIALQLEPRDAAARNNLAWLRATHPDARHRDAASALALASALARQKPDDPNTLDLLAAALAEAGRYGDAERTAATALAVARSSGRSDLIAAIEARRALYAVSRPYREDPAAVPVATVRGAAPHAVTARSPALPDASPRPPTPAPALVR